MPPRWTKTAEKLNTIYMLIGIIAAFLNRRLSLQFGSNADE